MNGVLFQGYEDMSGIDQSIFTDRGISFDLVKILIVEARKASKNSYAPYSHFNVGAAGLFQNAAGVSKVYAGANQENAAYSPVQCGETVAVARARFKGFHLIRAIAVYGMLDSSMPEAVREVAAKEWVWPCGRCRQVINETVAEDCIVITLRGDGQIEIVTFASLLPRPFGPKNLGIDPMAYRP